MPNNGLRAYGFHADEEATATRDLRERLSLGLVTPNLTQADPEAVARQYLGNAFSNNVLPLLTLPGAEGETQFTLLEIHESPFKKTKTVKFRQSVNRIPVHGSMAIAELDETNELVCLTSSLGEPDKMSAVPNLSATEALQILARNISCNDDSKSAPRISYYYQQDEQRWHLAYVFEDVVCPADAARETGTFAIWPSSDFVIDANDGQILDVLPRVCAATVTAPDAMNRPRRFQTSLDVLTAGQQMQNAALNVHTRDFAFQDVAASFNNLPGSYVKAPPLPWNPIAVSAHANTELVADFLLRVLGRRGLDGRGGPLISSINCVWGAMGGNGRNWPNSFWIKDQAVFGQRLVGPHFHSFATALDMVAHEFFHGVTQYSSRLDLKGQTGALNESYSDIFAVLIANALNPDWNAWRWELGTDTGAPLRDMRQPSRFNHPDHTRDYQNLPLNKDFGGIHINCGIHNKAAYNIMNSRGAQDGYLFAPVVIAQLFYHALLAFGPTALFSDSRRMIGLQAQTIFRNDPLRDIKLNAINGAFAAVGIN